MQLLEQHLLKINNTTPRDVLQHIVDKLIHTLQLTSDLEDDDSEAEFFWYIEELSDLLNLIPKSFELTQEYKDSIRGFINGMAWDNFMTEEGEAKNWKDGAEEGDFMTLGSMFYNKLCWVSEGSENEYLKEFANEYGGDLLIPFLDELEKTVKL